MQIKLFVSHDNKFLHFESKRASWESEEKATRWLNYSLQNIASSPSKERNHSFFVNLRWKLNITSDTQREAKENCKINNFHS